MGEDSDSETLATQGGITFFGNVFRKALGLVFLMVFTRIATESTVGLYYLALSVVLFILGVSNLSLHRTVDYFVPQYLREEDYRGAKGTLVTVVVTAVINAIVVGLALVVARGYVASLFNEPDLETVLPLFALALPLLAVNKVLEASYKTIKRMEFKMYTHDITRPVSKLLIMVVLVSLGWGIFGVVAAYVTAAALSAGVGVVLLARNARWLVDSPTRYVSIQRIMSYSLPLVFAGIIYTTVFQLDYFIIGYFEPSESVGIYRVAVQLSANVVIVNASLTAVFKPMIAERHDDRSALSKHFTLVTRWVTMLTYPVIIVLALAPETYLSILFTASFATAGPVVVVLSVGYLANAIGGPGGMMLEGLGHTRLSLLNSVALVMINFGLGVVLVKRIGILGAAIATIVALSTRVALGVVEIWHLHGVHPFSITQGKMLLAGIPAAAAGWATTVLTHRIALAVCLPIVVSLVYLSALRISGAFVEEDRSVAATIDDRIGWTVFEWIVPR